MAATSFHQFSQLPTEIRVQIWRETFPATDGIIANYDWRWFVLGVDDSNLPISNDRDLRAARKVQVSAPAIFFVNRESRDIAEDWAAKEGLEWQDLWVPTGTKRDEGDGGDGADPEKVGLRPGKQVLARDFDSDRDYVYLGWERKHAFKEWTLETIDRQTQMMSDSAFDVDEEGCRNPFPRTWSGSNTPPHHQAMSQMKHLVVPAFTGYYSTSLIFDIVKYRQVKKLYVLWGQLPQPVYALSESGDYCEVDVQPCWRLGQIDMVDQEEEEDEVDDEVEMYSYVSKARGRDPKPGDDSELYIEKGSLLEWMEELVEQLREFAHEDDACDENPALKKYLEEFEIVPVRLVQDGRTGLSVVKETRDGMNLPKGSAMNPLMIDTDPILSLLRDTMGGEDVL